MRQKEQMRCANKVCRGYLTRVVGTNTQICYGCGRWYEMDGSPLKAAESSRKAAQMRQAQQGGDCLAGNNFSRERVAPREEGSASSVDRHRNAVSPGAQTVTLPYPPSANHFKVPQIRKGHIHFTLSEEARQWKQDADLIVTTSGLKVVPAPVRVILHVYRPQKRQDLDNSIKLVLDSLRCYAIRDDEDITEIHAYRYEDKANPRVEITIEEI